MAHIDGQDDDDEANPLDTAGPTRSGEVHEGAAVMDWIVEEQERGITIMPARPPPASGATAGSTSSTRPGHVDFTVEAERSLRVLDGAVAAFHAVAGAELQTETVWRQAENYHVPAHCFVNKMDRVGADFFRRDDTIKVRLDPTVARFDLPLGAESELQRRRRPARG